MRSVGRPVCQDGNLGKSEVATSPGYSEWIEREREATFSSFNASSAFGELELTRLVRPCRARAASRPMPSSTMLAGSGTDDAVVAVNVDVFPETEAMSKFPNVVGNMANALINAVPEIGPIGPRRS